MPNQFVVPQFIDAEDKIIGPVTVRQFIILLVTFLTVAVLWRIMSFFWFIATGLPLIVIGGVVAFMKVNGQPFHYFILNLVQTLRRPRLRVWDKALTDSELRALSKSVVAPPPPPPVRKAPVSASRLAELSLVVNTGGVYRPEA